MDPERRQSGEGIEQLRWFAGVPVGTNPFILKDLAGTLALLWPGTVAFVAAAQLVIAGTIGLPHLAVAATIACYVVAFAAAAFALIAFPLLGNRYIVLCRLFPDAVWCESMRGRLLSLQDAFHVRPFPVEPPSGTGRTATKTVPWDRVRGFDVVAGARVIRLMGERGTLLRLYCPDDDTCGRAAAYIGERLKITTS